MPSLWSMSCKNVCVAWAGEVPWRPPNGLGCGGGVSRGRVEMWCPLESTTFDPGKCIKGGISSIPLKWHQVAPSCTTRIPPPYPPRTPPLPSKVQGGATSCHICAYLWGRVERASLGEDNFGGKVGILHRKVAHRAKIPP